MTTNNVNLVEFWTVQEASGLNSTAFLTYEAAQRQINLWNKELDEQLKKWKEGDYSVSSSLISSNLESDCEGGCYYSYHINDAFRPGGIHFHAKYSMTYWKELINGNLIKWGNPVLQRPIPLPRKKVEKLPQPTGKLTVD